MPAQTKRQREVLELFTRHSESNGYRPSYQQIATKLGLKSRAGIARIVRDLEGQGLLERRRENGHFSIQTLGDGNGVSISWLDVPRESDDTEEIDMHPLNLPAFMIGDYDLDEIRVFRSRDISLAPEIDIDDIVLIELRDYCRPGQNVVAVLNESEVVLRKYYRTSSQVELRAADESIETITMAANRVRIVGVCRGLIRPAV